MKFELVIDSKCSIAETPVWDPRINKLYWTDLFTGDIHQFDPATKADRMWKTDRIIGIALPCDDLDKLLVVVDDGAYLLDMPTGEMTLIANPEPGNTANRFSDARVDAAGRIFMSSVAKSYGTPDYTPDQRGALYMVERDGTVVKLEDGVNQYNTVTWNKDSTKMYIADTFNETLLEYDYDIAKGPTSGPRVVVDFKGTYGMPDGMSTDEDDNIYICHWCGKISVWDSDHNHLRDIEFPHQQVACGCFGGKDFSDLYVACAGYNYTPEQFAAEPGAGGTYLAHTDIKGCNYHFYKV